ncbi:MAG: 30S ribosome-binding factor RbfA [Armatimonadia bacterium]|nr:30S ribosome-binding factor RbfA [Armatimonadia bacterium]
MHRKQKIVARQIRDAISDIITREVKDPRVGIASVSHVELSADLRHAKVMISVIGETEEEMDESFQALENAEPFIRRMLGERVRLRHVPELDLQRDRGAEHAEKITRILREINEEDGEEPTHGDGSP